MIKSFSSFILIAAATIASCGKDGQSSNLSSPWPLGIENDQVSGTYKAILRPLNQHLSGFIPTGGAEIKIEGDTFKIKTWLDDDARVRHLQSIHLGARCPSLRDDKNNDQIIDIEEATQVVGEVLIPLDSDISTWSGGEGIYPTGSGFTYSERTSFKKLASEIRTRTGKNLNLNERVVLIHGTYQTSRIPLTVATRDGLSPEASVPVVCGILKKRKD
jgi:hypothetical protein